MADLIIKPATGAGNKLIIRDQAGNDLITTGNNLAGCTTKIGGHLQMKQFRKLSTLHHTNTGDVAVGAPFDGTSGITCSSVENWVRARYFTTFDHGITWRSAYVRMEYSTDGSVWHGLCGGGMMAWEASDTYHQNVCMVCLDHLFHPNSTSDTRVRLVKNGHAGGSAARMGQYYNEAADNANHAPPSTGGVVTVGHLLILEELSGSICSNTDVD